MNNILDPNNKFNHLFLASVIAVLCKDAPLTVKLEDVENFWTGDIGRLQYDMVHELDSKTGTITFSLKEKE